jgi:integrase
MQVSSDSNAVTSSPSQTTSLPVNPAADILTHATPTSRKRGKSLSRRRGQNGYIEKSGRWYVVRYWKDVPGQEKRALIRERICPISGPGSLSKSERQRKAREIIQASGADSVEYFKQVVKQETGITFHEQSKLWLEQLQSRKRNPIGANYVVTIQGALDKWILPVIGDFPLSDVDNLSVKPLIDKMHSEGLSARTVNKYSEFVKQVVESLREKNGEPVHKRTWDAETMDLPVVEHGKQKRPSFKADAITELVKQTAGQEQALYILLAATGMRVSEALAVETRHFINDGRTIVVEQQVEKDAPRIVPYLKTDAAKRQIDLHPDIAEYLRRFTTGKTGLLFQTANGTPHLHGNLAARWLTPRLIDMKLDEKGMGWHSFRRFRKTWLRGARCLEDLNNFWMGDKPTTMSELYSHLYEEMHLRLIEVERVGYGFTLPEQNASIIPIVPKTLRETGEEFAA